jgi:F420 biosynthesis protein FbiB-like protein
MGAKADHRTREPIRTESLRELVAGRRSIRRYLPLPIARELLHALLESATAAPSAHNRQPWRFAVVERRPTKERLARAMGERLRADRLRDGDPLEQIEADVARSQARLTGSPVLVLVCMTMADMDRYPDQKRGEAERLMAIQGTAMATQNLLLAAHAVGLGACSMCAPLFCPEAVSGALALPADWEPQALVTIGHPAAAGKPFRRRPLSDVTRYEDGEP